MPKLRLCFALGLVTLLAGCFGTERNVSYGKRVADPWGAVTLFDEQSRLVDPGSPLRGGRGEINILALSGGGADGAFGAGVLTQWSKQGRPKFDIVTGVSTGALQASFAFLGPRYDASLLDLYTNVQSADIFKSRGLAGIFGDSLLDTEPLKAKIASVITADVLREIANEHEKGRRLYVATTNLDAGVATVWDMGWIAGSRRPEAPELFREILRASAAVPGFFKPVEIRPEIHEAGAQLHVDGGVKTPMLMHGFMVEGAHRRKNVYVLVNGNMKLFTSGYAVPAGIAGIAKKSINELLRGLLQKTVYQAYATTRNAGGVFRLGYIPDDVPESKDPLEFDSKEMRALFQVGQDAVKSGKFWRSEPPYLAKLDRLAGAR